MTLRLLIDECCPPSAARLLRTDGHDCLAVRESFPSSEDELVGARAIADDRLLITEDQGFGERVVRHGLRLPGLATFNLAGWLGPAKAQRMLEVVREHGDRFRGHILTVDYAKVRIRPMA